MAVITKFVRLGLSPALWERITQEAKRSKISAMELIRTAVGKYLRDLKEGRIAEEYANYRAPKKGNTG